MCLICMKYRIIILIIIIKRLGEILLSYMANTSHTHARTHPVSMYFPSQHFMVLLVDDVVSRPITPEIRWPSGLGIRPATGRSMVRVPLR